MSDDLKPEREVCNNAESEAIIKLARKLVDEYADVPIKRRATLFLAAALIAVRDSVETHNPVPEEAKRNLVLNEIANAVQWQAAMDAFKHSTKNVFHVLFMTGDTLELRD